MTQMVIKAVPFVGNIKMTNEGHGGFEGHGNATAIVDDVGDIIVRGAYEKATLDHFLETGFNADSHDWSYRGVIGYPTEAKEDDKGLFFKAAFHSTPDAQDLRTKISERMKAGKAVFFSIGFYIMKSEKVYPGDYSKVLPKYLREDRLEAMMEKAKAFPYIQIIHSLELAEVSIVPRPANTDSSATGVKRARRPEQKGQHLGEGLERGMTANALSVAMNAMWWKVISTIYNSSQEQIGEIPQLLAPAYDELRDVSIRAIVALLGTGEEEARKKVADTIARKFISSIDHSDDLDETTLSKRIESVIAEVTAVGIVTTADQKAGRAISAARRKRLKELLKTLRQVANDVEQLLKETATDDDKEEDEDDDDSEEAKELQRMRAEQKAQFRKNQLTLISLSRGNSNGSSDNQGA